MEMEKRRRSKDPRDILKLDLSFWPGESGFKPLRFEWQRRATGRFMLLRYALDGKEQDLGIRFDLDKRAALDKLDDPLQQEALVEMVPSLCDFLTEHHFLWGKKQRRTPHLAPR